MMLVDSHCHLDFPDLAGELDAVVARAQAGDPALPGRPVSTFPLCGVRRYFMLIARLRDAAYTSTGLHEEAGSRHGSFYPHFRSCRGSAVSSFELLGKGRIGQTRPKGN